MRAKLGREGEDCMLDSGHAKFEGVSLSEWKFPVDI